MSLEQSVKHYIQDCKEAKQEALDDYIYFVVSRIAVRLDGDAEIEVLNRTSNPLEYTVPRVPDNQEAYSISKLVQKQLREKVNIDLTVTFKSQTKVVVHFPQGFFKY